jgi:hypothetical protein
MLHHNGGVEGVYIHVHHYHEIEIFHTMKVTCSKVAIKLCFELSHKFPNVEIMATLGMVYPQYWLCEKSHMKNFQVHLD